MSCFALLVMFWLILRSDCKLQSSVVHLFGQITVQTNHICSGGVGCVYWEIFFNYRRTVNSWSKIRKLLNESVFSTLSITSLFLLRCFWFMALVSTQLICWWLGQASLLLRSFTVTLREAWLACFCQSSKKGFKWFCQKLMNYSLTMWVSPSLPDLNCVLVLQPWFHGLSHDKSHFWHSQRWTLHYGKTHFRSSRFVPWGQFMSEPLPPTSAAVNYLPEPDSNWAATNLPRKLVAKELNKKRHFRIFKFEVIDVHFSVGILEGFVAMSQTVQS